MLLDVLLSFGTPKTAKKNDDNNVRGNNGGFVFQIEILGCRVKRRGGEKRRKTSCCANISPLITCAVH